MIHKTITHLNIHALYYENLYASLDTNLIRINVRINLDNIIFNYNLKYELSNGLKEVFLS